MASFQTTYLQEEINHRRGGEDSCNLDRDFDLHAPVGVRQVGHAPFPLAPWECQGVHGVGPTPAYGGLATQVLAPPTREV
jgi:hypothetical protein